MTKHLKSIVTTISILVLVLGNFSSNTFAQPKAPTAQAPTDKKPQIKPSLPKLVWIQLSGTLTDKPQTLEFEPQSPEKNLQQILNGIRKIPDDPQTLGLVIYLKGVKLKLHQTRQLYDAIREIRQKKRKVLIFSETYDLMSYALACASDRILLQYKGQVMLRGLATEELYLKDMLEKIGVKADFYQHGKYKGADEQLTRTGPSKAWDQNIDALLDDLYAQIIDMIAKGRNWDRNKIEDQMKQSWSLTDEQLRDQKIIDDLTVRSLVAVTSESFGDRFQWSHLFKENKTDNAMTNPLAVLSKLFGVKKSTKTKRPTIAVVHMDGPIVMGSSYAQAPQISFGEKTQIGSHTMIDIFNRISHDPNIKGVIVRINSPGGSALASELIWQSLQLATMTVPVYISVDRMAASGGYYIASAGNKIYANPSSILGSIGVIAGKMTLGGLYEKLGIHVTHRTRGPLGDFFNSQSPFTSEQRQVLSQNIRRTYELFLERIETGRPDKIQDISQVAQGRLFTGRQCIQNGLADKLGNLTVATNDMIKDLNLKEGEYDILTLPQPMPLKVYLEKMFGSLQSPNVTTAHPVFALLAKLNPQLAKQAQQLTDSIMLMHQEPVLTVMPVIINIH